MNANNIYVGNRYTPLFCGPWDDGTAYESLSAVTYTDGNAYVSKKPVPAGTLPTDPDYWVLWGSGNAALDSVTQRLNTVENNVESLENSLSQTQQDMPWKVSATLKGDGSTDNTLLFGALNPDTPIALLPGTYLITGNVTIPCAIQFVPGAVLKYNAATPGTNYLTVTFAKGFVCGDYKIFDTYIVPRIGANNATPTVKFSWYGGSENNGAQENSDILCWLMSSTMSANKVIIEPGQYGFSNIYNGTYFTATSKAIVEGVGVKMVGAVTTAPGTYRGIMFNGAVTSKGNSQFENCTFMGGIGGVNYDKFYNCIFNGDISSTYGNLYIEGGSLNWTSGHGITTMGTNGLTMIKDFLVQRNNTGLSQLFSLSSSNVNNIDGLNVQDNMSESSLPHFQLELSSDFGSVKNSYLPTGKLVCCVSENNNVYSHSASHYLGNIVKGTPYSGKQVFTVGYTLSCAVDKLYKQANVMQFELVRFNSDGTYTNMGAMPDGTYHLIGNNSTGTFINSNGNSITVDASETATSLLIVFKPTGSAAGNMPAYLVLAVADGGPVG